MEGANSVLKYVFFIFLFGFYSMSLWCQSPYGSFEDYGRYNGVYHTGINTLFEDSRGFFWIGSSDGLMRSDGVFFDTFSKENTFSSSLTDNTIKCIEEDVRNKVIWVGTSIGGINRFDITKKDSVNFYIEPDSSNTRGFVSVNAICQIDSTKFLVGTQSQGAYFFYPKNGVFIKLQSVFQRDIDFPKTIYRIVKAKNYIWICTSKGILQFSLGGEFLSSYFFNGKDFSIFPSGNDLSIPQVIEVSDNTIDFISNDFLGSFNWKENKVKIIYETESSIKLNCVEKDPKGYWLGTLNQGLLYLDLSSYSINHYRKNNEGNSVPNDMITDLKICQDSTVLWIATKDGLGKYDYHKSKFLQFNIEKLTNNELNSVFALAKDSYGNNWARGPQGLFRKEKVASKFSKVEVIGDRHVFRIFEDDSSRLWMPSDKGLISYDLKNKEFGFIEFEYYDFDTGDLNFITTYEYNDRDSSLWLMSKVGLIKFNVNTSDYDFFPLDSTHGLSNYRFTALKLTKDKNYFWIGSRRGELIKFDIKNKVYKKYNVKETQDNKYKPCIILDLAVDSVGKVWMATFGGGLLIFDESNTQVNRKMARDVFESYVYAIIDDENGNYWISTNYGIVKVNKKDNSTKLFSKADGTFCSEFNEGSCYRTKDGNILFGGINGFIEFNPKNIYKNVYVPKIYFSSFSENYSSTVYADEILDDVRYDVDSVITVQGDSELKIYAAVINFSLSNDNKIKWKLEDYDEEWKEGYSFETIIYSNLKRGSYILRLKGINNDGLESEDEAVLRINVHSKLIDTVVFKLLLVLLIVSLILLLIRVRALWQKSQKALLIERVNEKTEALTKANQELESSKEKIVNQKTELEIHRNYLEEIVELRTADLEQAKVKAEESDKLKTSFLANLSHEIRTPMNAIIGFSNLLMTGEFDEEQQKHFLNVINQSSESLLALINDIIDISRIETGNIELVKQETNIPDLIQEVSDELVFEKKSEEVKFVQSYNLSDADLELYIDRYRLKQIISNLLRNAFKFTANGYVKITVQSTDSEQLLKTGFSLKEDKETNFNPILFIIEDTGIGIKEEDHKLIFMPFQKAQDKKKLYDGMGLGLSIVRNLIDLFEGDIIVKSEYKKGTVFCFYINKNKHQFN